MFELTDTGLKIDGKLEQLSCSWDQIEEIFAVKRDTFNPNIVKLWIIVDGTDYEFEEADVDNYQAFSQSLAGYLESVRPYYEWWFEVTNPITKLQESYIYKRGE